MKQQPEFNIPDQLLTQINECSNGAWTLFLFSNNGNPRIYSNADNPEKFMAIQQHIANYAEAMHNFGVLETMESISPEEEPKKRRKRGES